jgi:uncharacterized membrane protein YebE (DUF533 family)
MQLKPPPPPPIDPRQMTLLRIVAAMAWADGNLAEEEVAVMLDRFSNLFATTEEQRSSLRQELREYLVQNIPIEELVPRLSSREERELVLKLGYEVIASSARTPDEDRINEEESAAYGRLVGLLGFAPEQVKALEMEVDAEEHPGGLIEALMAKLTTFKERG